MKTICCIWLTCLLLVLPCSDTVANDATTVQAGVTTSCRTHRATLEPLLRKRFTSPRHNIRLDALFGTDMLATTDEKIVLGMMRTAGLPNDTSRYIDNVDLLSAIVDCLKSRDYRIVSLASKILVENGMPEQLRALEERIIASVGSPARIDVLCTEYLELLVRLQTSRSKAVLGHLPYDRFKDDPGYHAVRAYLIPDAYTKLEGRFRSSKDSRKKGEIAHLLALIGNDTGIKLIASNLRDPSIDSDTRGLRISTRFYLIRALGYAFPKSKLLNDDLLKIESTKPRGSAKTGEPPATPGTHTKYCGLVEKWASDELFIQFSGPLPKTPLLWSFPQYRISVRPR